MALSLLEWMYVEQGVMAALALFFFVIFTLLLYAEQFQVTAVKQGNVKFKLHRLGLFMAVLLCLLSIDPLALHNIFPLNLPPWIQANITAALLCAIIFLNEVAAQVVYASQMRPVPVFVNVVTWGLVFFSFLVANVSYGLVFFEHKWFYSGFFLLYVAVAFAVLIGSFVFMTLHILATMDKAMETFNARQPHGLKRSPSEIHLEAESKKNGMKLRAVFVFILGAIVVPIQINTAIARLSDTTTKDFAPNLDEYDISDHLLTYFQVIAVFIALWYSWMPLHLSHYDRIRSSSDSNAVGDPARKSSADLRRQGSSEWKNRSRSRLSERSSEPSRPSISSSHESADPAPTEVEEP